jgi:hypothetical protein
MYKFILAILLLLSSCISVNYDGVDNRVKKLPKWYIDAPRDDIFYLYGLGIGGSLQESTRSALNNAAEKILVTISSSFENKNQSSEVNSNSVYESKQYQKISAQIKKIDFTNYNLIKSEQLGNNIYSLVKIEKSIIIEYYLNQIKKNHDKILANTKSLEDLSYIEQFIKIYQMRVLISQNQSRLDIVNIISQDKSITELYSKYYNILFNKQTWLKDNIKLRVVAQLSDKRIAELIASELNEIGIKVIENNDNNDVDKNIFLLRVNSATNNNYLYNSHITKIRVGVKLIKNFGSQISAGELESTGSSVNSKLASFDAAIFNLRKEIKKVGILKFLGL